MQINKKQISFSILILIGIIAIVGLSCFYINNKSFYQTHDHMGLDIKKMDMAETIDQTLAFQTDNTPSNYRDRLFREYPELDKTKGLDANWANRKIYLEYALADIYKAQEHIIDEKVIEFDKHWKNNQTMVRQAFNSVFGIEFDDLSAEVSINPVNPRWLNEHRFTVFYKSTPERFMEIALHEAIHFAWFQIWQSHFKDDKNEYNGPHLKWILSEAVVDTIVKNTELKELYSEKGLTEIVYPYFYTMRIDGKLLLDTLSEMYKNNEITGFMESAYDYFQKHESEIREQSK